MKLHPTLAFLVPVAFLVIGTVTRPQQTEKRITLPPVTASQLNIIVTALQTCDCPSKSTPELLNSFVGSARQQAPEWFGLKADTTKKGGKP